MISGFHFLSLLIVRRKLHDETSWVRSKMRVSFIVNADLGSASLGHIAQG